MKMIERASTKHFRDYETCWAEDSSSKRVRSDQLFEGMWVVRSAARVDPLFPTWAPPQGQDVDDLCSSQSVLNRQIQSATSELGHHLKNAPVFLFSLLPS